MHRYSADRTGLDETIQTVRRLPSSCPAQDWRWQLRALACRPQPQPPNGRWVVGHGELCAERAGWFGDFHAQNVCPRCWYGRHHWAGRPEVRQLRALACRPQPQPPDGGWVVWHDEPSRGRMTLVSCRRASYSPSLFDMPCAHVIGRPRFPPDITAPSF